MNLNSMAGVTVFVLVPLLCALSAVTMTSASFTWDDVTPLDQYVMRRQRNDPYRYRVTNAYTTGQGYDFYVLRVTSLKWKTPQIARRDRVWKHWMTVIVPHDVRIYDAAMLRIEGGDKNDNPPNPNNFYVTTERLIEFAVATGAVAAEIKNVMHQPVKFLADNVTRSEDFHLGRTWREFLMNPNASGSEIAMFPMVRAARRAVDTVIHFTHSLNRGFNISHVMPSGRSKRGWVSYLLAAVDRRAFATYPEAFGTLSNTNVSMAHYRALGGWSWAGFPYWINGIMGYNAEPVGAVPWDELALDASRYYPRLADIPKMATLGVSEEFFLADGPWYYWPQMPGQKLLRMVANTSHRLREHYDSIWKTMASFFTMAYYDFLPTVNWTRSFAEGGEARLVVSIDREPLSIRGWVAETTNLTIDTLADGTTIHRRDFRDYILESLQPFALKANPIIWREVQPTALEMWDYALEFDAPAQGFRAFFMEIEFAGAEPDNPDLNSLVVTTEVQITPDVYPYPACTTYQECQGRLV